MEKFEHVKFCDHFGHSGLRLKNLIEVLEESLEDRKVFLTFDGKFLTQIDTFRYGFCVDRLSSDQNSYDESLSQMATLPDNQLPLISTNYMLPFGIPITTAPRLPRAIIREILPFLCSRPKWSDCPIADWYEDFRRDISDNKDFDSPFKHWQLESLLPPLYTSLKVGENERDQFDFKKMIKNQSDSFLTSANGNLPQSIFEEVNIEGRTLIDDLKLLKFPKTALQAALLYGDSELLANILHEIATKTSTLNHIKVECFRAMTELRWNDLSPATRSLLLNHVLGRDVSVDLKDMIRYNENNEAAVMAKRSFFNKLKSLPADQKRDRRQVLSERHFYRGHNGLCVRVGRHRWLAIEEFKQLKFRDHFGTSVMHLHNLIGIFEQSLEDGEVFVESDGVRCCQGFENLGLYLKCVVLTSLGCIQMGMPADEQTKKLKIFMEGISTKNGYLSLRGFMLECFLCASLKNGSWVSLLCRTEFCHEFLDL